ncbi:MAG TPA: hypothetical protein VF400_06380 [Anaeromyxobacteraceae bacterium]
MIDSSDIRQGMTVYSLDGEKLGQVVQCDASTFVIEKGFFFPKGYVARFDDVSLVSGDEIRLSRERAHLGEDREERDDELAEDPIALLSGGGGQETLSTGRHRRERLVERRAAGEDDDAPVVNFGEDSGAIDPRDPDGEP